MQTVIMLPAMHSEFLTTLPVLNETWAVPQLFSVSKIQCLFQKNVYCSRTLLVTCCYFCRRYLPICPYLHPIAFPAASYLPYCLWAGRWGFSIWDQHTFHPVDLQSLWCEHGGANRGISTVPAFVYALSHEGCECPTQHLVCSDLGELGSEGQSKNWKSS